MAPSHGALDALLMKNFSLDSCLSGWKRRREVEAEEDVTMQSLLDLIQNQKEAMASPRKKRKSRKKGTSARMFVMDSATGKPRIGTPDNCVWWVNHVTHPENMTARMQNKFKRWFRMPFKLWQELVEIKNQHILCKPWHCGNKDCIGSPYSPI